MPKPSQNPPGPMLLTTKLNMPRQKANLVLRQDLLNRLTESLQYGSGLFLLSAPAGYGKTTLICEWLNNESYNYTWLSLDEKDNDPVRFLTYLVAAFRKSDSGGRASYPEFVWFGPIASGRCLDYSFH